MMVTLITVGYQKLGLTDETGELRDLDDAGSPSSCSRALLDVLERRRGEAALKELRATLAQMQLAYAQAVERQRADRDRRPARAQMTTKPAARAETTTRPAARQTTPARGRLRKRPAARQATPARGRLRKRPAAKPGGCPMKPPKPPAATTARTRRRTSRPCPQSPEGRLISPNSSGRRSRRYV